MNSTSEFDETQRPWATWILSALCLLWFVLAGRIALAGRWDNLRWFLLMGDPHAQDTLGALSAAAIEDGEWWRLITTLFVHQDFFHLLINLSTFFGYGRRLERLWGSWRFALIYLFAGLTGAAVALAADPTGRLIGSSASISGILLSAAVWFLLNRRRLPPEASRAGVRQSLLAFAWLAGWWALLSWLGGTKFPWVFFLGGAVAGAILALPLHAQMAIPSPTRWAFLVLTLLVPLSAISMLVQAKVQGETEWAAAVAQAKAARQRQAQQAQQREQRGQEQDEYDRFNQKLLPEILKGDRFYEKRWDDIAELTRTPPAARPRLQLEDARRELAEVRTQVANALDKLRQSPVFTVDRVESAARAARRYLEDLDDLLRATEQVLAEGAAWDESLTEKAEQTHRSARNFNRSLRAR